MNHDREDFCQKLIVRKNQNLLNEKQLWDQIKRRFSPCSCYNKRKGDALVMRENSIIGRIIAFCAICFAFFNPKTVTYWLDVRAESGPAWYLTTVVACGIAVFVLIDLIKKIKRRKAAE